MAVVAEDLAPPRRFSLATAIRRNPTIAFGGLLLAALIVMAVARAAVIATGDPFTDRAVNRLRPPSDALWFGTDQLRPRRLLAHRLWRAHLADRRPLRRRLRRALLGLAIGLACRLLPPASTAWSCASWTG